MLRHSKVFHCKLLARLAAALIILGLGLITSGCGSSSTGAGTTPLSNPSGGSAGPNGNSTQQKSPVQVRLGDAPSDRIVTFQATLNSVKLTLLGGDVVQLLPNPVTIELVHLSETSEPVSVVKVTQGTYTQAQIALGSANLTYVDPITDLPVTKQFTMSSPITVTFNPRLEVNSNAAVMSFDFDLAHTVNLDMVKGTISLNPPVIKVSQTAVPASGQEQPESGGVDHLVGQVTSVGGPAFTMTVGQSGQPMGFLTGSATTIVDASLNTLPGMLIEVNGTTNADGTFTAQQVQAYESSTGVVMQGLFTGFTTSGNMNVVFQDGAGSGMEPSLVGASISANVGNAAFSANTNGIDMTGLSLVFDASDFSSGQNVEATSPSAMQADPDGNVGLLTSDALILEQQTVSGTVSSYTAGSTPGTGTFYLTLPMDNSSYLTGVAGVSSVAVYQQAGTNLVNLPSGVQNGQTVRVRGLLFYNVFNGFSAEIRPSIIAPPQQSFVMVAGRISQ